MRLQAGCVAVAGWVRGGCRLGAWRLQAGDEPGCKEGRAIRGAPGKSAHAQRARRSTAQARKSATPSGLESPFCAPGFSLERRAALSPPASLSAGLAPPPWPEGPGLAAERVAMPPRRSSMGKSSAELIIVAATWARREAALHKAPNYLPTCLPACLPAHPPTYLPKYLAIYRTN